MNEEVVMYAMLGRENMRDIEAVFDGLSRLVLRGMVSASFSESFIDALSNDLVEQQIAQDAASGPLPSVAGCPDTARSEAACKESNSG